MTLRSTRFGSLAVACTLGNSLVGVCQAPAHAADTAIHDIDGDGQADLVIGRPGWDNNSGAVEVVLSTGAQTLLTASDVGGSPQADAAFGWSVLVRDFDQDGFADVAIGEPHLISEEHRGFAGEVYIVPGSSTGPDLTRAWSLGSGALDDQYGWSLAALGSTSAPTALVVGAPLAEGNDPPLVVSPAESITAATSTRAFAGEVVVHPITEGRIAAGSGFSQNSYRVPGASEDGDRFGHALDASGQMLIVGTPYEAVGTRPAAGSVTLMTFAYNGLSVTSSMALTQDTTGIPDTASGGDYFGYSVAAMGNLYAASAPGENIGTVVNTGLVQPFTYTAGGSVSAKPALHQNVTGVPGANEKNDYFGESIDLLRPVAGGRAVIVGTPQENVGSVVDAGTATVVRVDGTAFSAKLIQGGGSLSSPLEAYANTGLTVRQVTPFAGSTVDRVAVSSPGTNGGDGLVSILKAPFTSTYVQITPSIPEPGGSGFGYSVNKVPNPVK